MSRGDPRAISGSNIPARRSWTKPSEEMINADARGSWEPRSGVGSFLPGILDVLCRQKARRYTLEDEVGIQSQDNWIAV
jgi:hypothetical protein